MAKFIAVWITDGSNFKKGDLGTIWESDRNLANNLPPEYTIIEIPSDLDSDCIKAIFNGSSVQIIADPDKAAAKLAKKWAKMRADRDVKLTQCDWTQIPDCNISNKSDWTFYRQALRDLPSITADPSAPVWPAAPVAPKIAGLN